MGAVGEWVRGLDLGGNSLKHDLAKQPGSRYWWHHQKGHNYLAPVYAVLGKRDRQIIAKWYKDTDQRFPGGAGESCVPVLSMLQGLIMGNGIGSIVQCGHYHGYSTLLIGMFLRLMGRRRGLFSVDINPEVTEYTQSWLRRAQLEDVVRLKCASSIASEIPDEARTYFGSQKIGLVYIDSSHAYTHTLQELEFWFGELVTGGFLVVHDASRFARNFCCEQAGGVNQALEDWNLGTRGSMLWMNKHVSTQFDPNSDCPPYADPCGLAVIQKLV